MANNTYIIDYAPTGRAACKFGHCKEKIGQGELRLAKSFPSDRFTDGGAANEYYHPQCWFETQKKTKKTTKKIESEDDINGFDDIKKKDQDAILELLRHKDDPPLFKKGAKKKDGTASPPSTPKKPKKQVYVDSDEEKYLKNDSDDNKSTPKKNNPNKNIKMPVKNNYNDDDSDNNNNKNNNKNKNNTNNNSNNKNNNNNNNNNNKNNKNKQNSDDEASEDLLEKDAWGTVAANGSRVAKVLNSTAIKQVSVLILGSASRKSIKRVALESDEDRSFSDAFGFGSSDGGDPDSWLQWLAGLGVLWISSDSADAGFTSAGLWFDSMGMIVKQVFMAKPKKGLVVVLWGSEVKHFKKEAQKHYQALMGTVPFRIVEGPTPLNGTFNPRDMLKKIDTARSELGMSTLQWWPHEGEIAHNKNNNSINNNNNNNNNNTNKANINNNKANNDNNNNANNSAKKKVVKQSSLISDGNLNWQLESEEINKIVELSEEPTELGRTLVGNKKISRKQCSVKVVPNGIELTPLGVNPMTLSRRKKMDDVEILSKDETYTLNEGDSFTLCGEQYRFVLKRSEKKDDEKKTPIKKKEPSGDSDNDKTRIGDDDDEEEKVEKVEKVEKETEDKKGTKSSTESESATVPFSAVYDDESSKEEEKEVKKEVKKEIKKDKKDVKEPDTKKEINKEKKDVKMGSDEEVDDEELARRMQEEFDKETKKKSPSNTPKSKHSSPDKDEILARKLQSKFNKEGGDSGSKKRKQEDDDDDEEVNWAAKVKKPKKGKKGNDDDDGDWAMGGSSDNDNGNDDDDEEYNDEDEKPNNKNNKNNKKGGGGGGGGSAKKQPCKYGSNCFRKNPDHYKEFSHPK